jgi:uncharacterized protein
MFVIGVLNGSLVSSTGWFATLWLIDWRGFEYYRAAAYVLVIVGLIWNASGALSLGLLADIEWTWLPALLLGTLIGGYLAAHLALVKGNHLIKRTFEIMTLESAQVARESRRTPLHLANFLNTTPQFWMNLSTS